MQDGTTPLIKGSRPNTKDDAETISRFAAGTVQTLGYLRAITGAAVLIAPLTMGKLFHIPVTAQTAVLGEMAGVRDIAVGELLLLADKKDKERKELKRMLWANIAVDAVDAAACGYGLAVGTMSRAGAGLLGGGALLFLALGVTSLRSL